MKGILTAGGRGTRLRPITFAINKHLIPIANKPMIFYGIESLKDAGITDIAITYNNGLEELQNIIGDGSEFGVSITFIQQKQPIGLADCVRVCEKFVDGDDFVFYLGDNLLSGGISKYIQEFHEGNSDISLLLARVPDPQRFGVPTINSDGHIVEVIEKPKNPQSDFAVTGIYFYTSDVFKCFYGEDRIKPSARGELEISDLHTWMINHGYKVGYSVVGGWYKDTGVVNDLLEANRIVLHGQKRKYLVGENSYIDTETTINEAVSIGNNCSIEGSNITNSIILDGVRLKNVDLKNSLVGNNVEIEGTSKTHETTLIVGDNSKLWL